MAKLLGISGSPIPNSNTDRAVLKILEESGAEYEFVKLSNIKVGPCRACKACVSDNICKVRDDFQVLAEKMKACDGYVIGCYTPYCMIDAFTKSLFERMWSMRHNNAMNEGKLCVSVVTSLVPDIAKGVHEAIMRENMMEGMISVGNLTVGGNVPCLTCGSGHVCRKGNVAEMLSGDPDGSKFIVKFEEQAEVYNKAKELGKELKAKLEGK